MILVNTNFRGELRLLAVSRIHERGCAMYEFLQETVANNMTKAVRSVAPEITVGDLYRLFAADDFDAYPVVRDDALVGMAESAPSGIRAA